MPGTILAKPIENRQVLTCFGKGKRNDTQLSIFAATLFFSCYGASLINWVRRENIFLFFFKPSDTYSYVCIIFVVVACSGSTSKGSCLAPNYNLNLLLF